MGILGIILASIIIFMLIKLYLVTKRDDKSLENEVDLYLRQYMFDFNYKKHKDNILNSEGRHTRL